MSDSDKLDQLIKLLESVVVAKRDDWANHQEQHQWIAKQMKTAEAKEEFWSGVASKVISGSIWAGIGALVSVLVYALKAYLSTT